MTNGKNMLAVLLLSAILLPCSNSATKASRMARPVWSAFIW